MTRETIAINVPVFEATTTFDSAGGECNRMCSLCSQAVEAPSDGDWVTGSPKPRDTVVVSATWGTVHAACFVKVVEEQSAAGAWVVLGREMAKAPSRYSASQVRAVLTQLTRLAQTPSYLRSPGGSE